MRSRNVLYCEFSFAMPYKWGFPAALAVGLWGTNQGNQAILNSLLNPTQYAPLKQHLYINIFLGLSTIDFDLLVNTKEYDIQIEYYYCYLFFNMVGW